MKPVLTLAIATAFLFSCGSDPKSAPDQPTGTDTGIEATDTTNATPEEVPAVAAEFPQDIPTVSELDVASYNHERGHKYGGGDCFGVIREYTANDMQLVTDTMGCGEYGSTYTYYIMNNAGELMGVRNIEYEASAGAEKVMRSWHESFYDFREGNAFMLIRKDKDSTEEYALDSVAWDTFELGDAAKEAKKWVGIRDNVWNQGLQE